MAFLGRVRGRLSCLAGGHPICPRGGRLGYAIPDPTGHFPEPLLLSNTHKYKYKDKMVRISETSPSWAVLGMPAASRISLRDKHGRVSDWGPHLGGGDKQKNNNDNDKPIKHFILLWGRMKWFLSKKYSTGEGFFFLLQKWKFSENI